MSNKTIYLQKSIHYGKVVLGIRFDRDADLEATIRKISGSRWSRTLQCWYLPFQRQAINTARAVFEPLAQVDYSALDVDDTKTNFSDRTENNVRVHAAPLPEQIVKALARFDAWLKGIVLIQ